MTLAKAIDDASWEIMCNSIEQRTGIEIIGQMELRYFRREAITLNETSNRYTYRSYYRSTFRKFVKADEERINTFKNRLKSTKVLNIFELNVMDLHGVL